ncbi:MAG TPA: hypothetical protein VFF00_05305 [Candidatus Elarobacter sp.]|nr:hypothetical protein [Dongiaceae bacterium]HZW53431.1 hypothetical protein [Candidatus Elarobacter sp.]
MKRTPPWVFVAAAGVQLAALGLCLWAMARRADVAEALPAPPEPPSPPLPAAEPAAALEPATPAKPEESRWPPQPEPFGAQPEPPAVRFGEPPGFFAEMAEAEPRPAVRVQEPPPPAAPLFGPPPARPPESAPDADEVPRFIAEAADDATQVVRGIAAEGRFVFGFYPDGNIRFVDVDGGRFAGKAESARARMREVDGSRAFTVQIGITADGRLQAAFTGGPHDGETVALEPHAGWSVA